MHKPTRIGLTGPTGSGKGEVAALLRARGLAVVDCDTLAREVTVPGHPCLTDLAQAFSDAILHADGSLDRAALARLAFADARHEALLNQITHPYILALCRARAEQLQQDGARAVVWDAPLLFESGLDRDCDTTLAVLAPADTRLRRIMARDGLCEADARRRMQAQPDDDYYCERAHTVLYNDGDLTALREQVEAWLLCTL